jgi:SulP family sulfate permease
VLRRLSQIRYSFQAFSGDLLGGLIAALIAVPYGLAMASLMGLPPVLGLVTSIVTAPVTALLGRNPVLIGGTASATVPFTAHAVQQQGLSGAAKVCFVAALFMLLFCALRLGRYIQRIPQPVVAGFSCGIGTMMFLSQLSIMMGVKVSVNRTSNNLLYQTWQVLSHAADTRMAALIVSAVVIAGAFASAHFLPKAPAPMIGVLAAVAASAIFGLHEREVGKLQLDFPSLAGFRFSKSDLFSIVPAGFGLAVVSSVNLLVTSRIVEHFRGRHKHLKISDADVELGAYGVANIFAGMFAAPMSVGIPARSLANVRCGGTTRLSNIFHACFILAFLELGAEALARVPIPALAGVTAYLGICLLEWSTWRRLPRMRPVDAAAFLSTAVAVLIVNAVLAVAIGCAFYLARYVYVMARRRRVSSLHIARCKQLHTAE